MENSNNGAMTGESLKNVITEILEKMGFLEISVSVKGGQSDGGEILICDIETKDSNFLIGQHGVNLQALQHLSRVLVRKRIADKVNFILDVNSYRQEKNDSIIKLAKSLAEDALREKRAIVMRPMSPYERRLVHLEMSKIGKVRTESIGEGEDRRIVIKPSDLI